MRESRVTEICVPNPSFDSESRAGSALSQTSQDRSWIRSVDNEIFRSIKLAIEFLEGAESGNQRYSEVEL